MKKKSLIYIISIIFCFLIIGGLCFFFNRQKENNLLIMKNRLQKLDSYELSITSNFPEGNIKSQAKIKRTEEQNSYYMTLEKSDNKDQSGTFEYVFKKNPLEVSLNVYYEEKLLHSQKLDITDEKEDSTALLYDLAEYLSSKTISCQESECVYKPSLLERNDIIIKILLPTFGAYSYILQDDLNFKITYFIEDTSVKEIHLDFDDGNFIYVMITKEE